MNAINLLSYSIPTLKPSTLGREALELMSDNYVQHLPLVVDEKLVGLISEDDVLNNEDDRMIGSYNIAIQKAQVRDTDHIFDVLGQIDRTKLSVLPVVNNDEKFLGVISQNDLVNFFASSFSFAERGSILVLEMSKPDYSLSEISRVVESEGVAIISSFITGNAENNKIFVHIKINKPDVHRVAAALERYEYNVFASYTEQVDSDVFQDRYESFMHYLNL